MYAVRFLLELQLLRGKLQSGLKRLANQLFFPISIEQKPIPVAVQSKASVCGRSPAEIVGSNTPGGMDVFLL
jgi:hypothetical protein